MKFESVDIKNFRNFNDVQVNLSNKNVFFGMNDIGKTNFLYALRYIFDRDIRKLNFLDSDYHNKDIKSPIEITVTLSISDMECEDSQKLRAQLRGAILSSHEKVFIKLIAHYDETTLIGTPTLFWGGDINNLFEMKQRAYQYEIDYVFNVFYLDSYINLYELFRKNLKVLVRGDDDEDKNTIDEINKTINELNNHISLLSGIKKFEENITPDYRKFRDEKVSISIKSEIAVKGLYSNITPCIREDGDQNIYPTSGDGRRKLLSYSIYNLLSDETEEKKINIFLVEEPENHLHRSLQIALSKILFVDEKYRYLFISTHSPYVLYEMDSVNLVRIFNETKIKSESAFYSVPEEYRLVKKSLNRSLSEAIFSDVVLLVEGPSEQILFEKVLSVMKPFYDVQGIYILPINGIGFQRYISILNGLKIVSIVKTDNDFRANKGGYDPIGFIRVNKIVGEQLPRDAAPDNTIETKIEIYNKNKSTLDGIRERHMVFLSKSDLENDLNEAIPDRLIEVFGKDPVSAMQNAKHYNMVELINKLNKEDCSMIYEHYNFACLKRLFQ